MEYKCKGLVFKKTDWQESSVIYQCYSEQLGFCSIIAKGIKKDKRNIIEVMQLFNQVEFILSKGDNSDMYILKSASAIKINTNSNYYSHAIKSAVMEIMYHLFISPEESTAVYDYLIKFLNYIDKAQEKQLLHFIRFVYCLLDMISHQILHICCDYCHSEKKIVTAIEEQGHFVCADCLQHIAHYELLNPDLQRIIYDNQAYWTYVDSLIESPELIRQFKLIFYKQYYVHFNKKIELKSLELI